MRRRRAHQGPLHDSRHALLLQERGYGLAHTDLADRILGHEARVVAVRLGRHPQFLAVLCCEGPQRVLHAVAQLAQDILRYVTGILRYKIDTYALRPDQARDLLHLVDQRLGGIVEQKVRLVEEEHHLGLVRVANLRQFLEQFRKQPQQEGRVKPRRSHQLVRRQDRDHAPPVRIGAHHVRQLQRRLPEELRSTLVFQHKQPPLDRPDGRGRDIAVPQAQLRTVLAHPDQKGLQVLEIQQGHAFFIGDTEGDIQDAFLCFRQLHQTRQQQRPHLADGCADRVALLTEQVPEQHREFLVDVRGKADLLRAVGKGLVQLEVFTARLSQPGQIALHIRQVHRNPGGGKAFSHDLKRDGLARPGSPGDQPVPVGVVQGKPLLFPVFLAATADKDMTLQLRAHPPDPLFRRIFVSEHTILTFPCQYQICRRSCPFAAIDFLPVILAAPEGAVFFGAPIRGAVSDLSVHK